MNIITLDFETYFDNEYTLLKMTTEEYIRDPRFEIHGVGIRLDKLSATHWYPGAQLYPQKPSDRGGLLHDIDWANTALLCHHGQFEGLILSHHFGIVPMMYMDTMAMGRLLFGQDVSVSLASLAKLFNLPEKNVPYELFKGKHWWELTPEVQRLVADGCCHDVDLTWDCFQRMSSSFPSTEYAFVDATVRMFSQPILEGDTHMLGEIWKKEAADKAALLTELGVTAADLRKNWKFAELLRAEGVEPEQKPGKPAQCKRCAGTGQVSASDEPRECEECNGEGTTAKWIYSFAKTDDFMRGLLDDEDDRIAMLAQAKLDAHSNGVQTRTARMGNMSVRGAMCVYLNYAGTHLAGWSGGDKVNWQNFKRGGPIAKAIRAPKGFVCVVADASQVECRLLNEVAGQTDVIDRFRARQDPYVALASNFYGEPVYKPGNGDPRQAEMEAKRGTGKQGELSCGYGAGGPKIKQTAKNGTYGPPVYLTDEEALRLRDTYRQTHPRVVQLWNEATEVLKHMAAGATFEWNVVHVENKIMWLPGDLPCRYDSLEWYDDGDDKGWRVRTSKKGWSRIWGSKMVENLIQGLRNSFIRGAWAECRAAGLDMVTMEHDKLCTVVREHEADDALKFLQRAMCRSPSWLPNIPLDSEGYISETLAKSNT